MACKRSAVRSRLAPPLLFYSCIYFLIGVSQDVFAAYLILVLRSVRKQFALLSRGLRTDGINDLLNSVTVASNQSVTDPAVSGIDSSGKSGDNPESHGVLTAVTGAGISAHDGAVYR